MRRGAQDTIPQSLAATTAIRIDFPRFSDMETPERTNAARCCRRAIGIQFVSPDAERLNNRTCSTTTIAAARLDAVENIAKVIEIEVMADRPQGYSLAARRPLPGQLAFQLEIELIPFPHERPRVSGASWETVNTMYRITEKGARPWWLSALVTGSLSRSRTNVERNQARPTGICTPRK